MCWFFVQSFTAKHQLVVNQRIFLLNAKEKIYEWIWDDNTPSFGYMCTVQPSFGSISSHPVEFVVLCILKPRKKNHRKVWNGEWNEHNPKLCIYSLLLHFNCYWIELLEQLDSRNTCHTAQVSWERMSNMLGTFADFQENRLKSKQMF